MEASTKSLIGQFCMIHPRSVRQLEISRVKISKSLFGDSRFQSRNWKLADFTLIWMGRSTMEHLLMAVEDGVKRKEQRPCSAR